MRILYIGCVESSYIILQELINNKKNICGVLSKKESFYNADFKDMTHLCVKNNIKIYYTQNINDIETLEYIRKIKPDIIYCFGWSQLLNKKLIEIPPLGVVGFHPAKLPFNKGRHPIIWALALGLEETASTFFMIDEIADNGSIISQEMISIDIQDDAKDLYEKVLNHAKKQAIIFTNQFENNKVNYIIQDVAEGNIWRKRTKADGKIDFRMGAISIYNLVRGLTKPYVGAHFEYNNKDYKVWKCIVVEDSIKKFKNIEFGKILEVYSNNSFLVKSGDDLVKILDCDKIELKVGDYL